MSPYTGVAKLFVCFRYRSAGDLMDAVTVYERRVTSWEHEAKETLSDLIHIGVVIKCLERRWIFIG